MSAALEPCAFCQIAPDAIGLENDLAFAIPDGFPVTPLHALVIPKRHESRHSKAIFARLSN